MREGVNDFVTQHLCLITKMSNDEGYSSPKFFKIIYERPLTYLLNVIRRGIDRHKIKANDLRAGGDSQNFLRKFLIFFVTLGLKILRL